MTNPQGGYYDDIQEDPDDRDDRLYHERVDLALEKQASRVEPVTITVLRYRDHQGRPTCGDCVFNCVDLLQVDYKAPFLGEGSFGIGNVLDKGVDLFQSPAFFSSLFKLGGFNLQIGESFVIDFINGAMLPSTSLAMSAINPILQLPDTLPSSVPEPATWAMLLAGLLALLRIRRQPMRVRPAGAPHAGVA
jgi:hypothetical protein